METGYILFIVGAATALTGFLMKQALADRDKRFDNNEQQMQTIWHAVRQLQISDAVHTSSLERMIKTVDKLGDEE